MQAVGRDGARIQVAVGVVEFVDQDQAKREQAALRQQQRADHVGAGADGGDDQHAQAVAPDVGHGVAQPGAAQRAAPAPAVTRVIGHQRQPRHRHGDHQVQRLEGVHAAVAGALPQRVQPGRVQLQSELHAQPDQRQHHQRQADTADDAAHQREHGAAQQQQHDGAPQQRRRDQARVEAESLLADGARAVAHDDQLEGGPAQQLHHVEQDRQAREAAAVGALDQAGAGLAAGAAQPRHPGQQAGAQEGAEHHRQQRALRAHGGHQVGAHLHHQQADAQAEPQGGVLAPAEYALGRRERGGVGVHGAPASRKKKQGAGATRPGGRPASCFPARG